MRRQQAAAATALRRVRCAVYTRKSTDEGLDSEFHSLDAQREAGESYIASQRLEGWVASPIRYDDGGFSGGTLERPALQRLLEEVEAGRVDCIVVYKIDRLSRSLLDFAKLIEIFDRHNVSFVSVTQRFDTSTSMGRLMLNILLSFAQFEREIIGERIRDKVAATKRKGKYTGGPPVLGYDVDRGRKRLVVNPGEAALVQRIFSDFIETGSTTTLAQALNAEGYTTKSWTTKKGKHRSGTPWNKVLLYRILNCRLYLGEVTHKGQHYPGEHEAIITREMWDRAHSILARNNRVRGVRTRTKTPALLRGLIRCAHCGSSMVPTFTKRRGKVYRYYVCLHASRHGAGSCPVGSVPAGEIEGAVVDQLRAVFESPEVVAATLRAAREQAEARVEQLVQERVEATARLATLNEEAQRLMSGDLGDSTLVAGRLADLSAEVGQQERSVARIDGEIEALSPRVPEREVIEALSSLDPVWEELFPAEQERIAQLLVRQVEVGPEGLDLELRAEGLESLALELGSQDREEMMV
jgi:site-specific DNA recombinase